MTPSMVRSLTFWLSCLLTVGATAVFLHLSVTRGFLPGMAELSVAFAVGVLFLVATMGAREQRDALGKWVERRSAFAMAGMLAGAMWLAAAAGLAEAFTGFPWPVALLGGAVVVLLSLASDGARQESAPAPGR